MFSISLIFCYVRSNSPFSSYVQHCPFMLSDELRGFITNSPPVSIALDLDSRGYLTNSP
jgi:hypothetical protein